MNVQKGWLLSVGRVLLVLVFLAQYASAGIISSSSRSVQPSSTPNASSRAPSSRSIRRTSTTSTTSSSGIVGTPSLPSAGSSLVVPGTRSSSSFAVSIKTSHTPIVNHGTSSVIVPSSSTTSSSSTVVAPSSSGSKLPNINTSTTPRVTSTKSSLAAGGPATSTGTTTSTSSSFKVGGSASTPVVSAAPSVVTSTVVQNGVTKTVPIIIDGSVTPITLPPATTTITGALATSSVSSVSSEIMALIPILNSWKSDTESLKKSTLNSVENVKNDVETIISNLGGSSSSYSSCSSKKKKKRGLFDFIGNAISALTCIAEDLTHVTDDINLNDITGVESLITSLTSSTDDLNDENDNQSSEKNSETDSTTTTSSSTCTSSTTTTALRVTVLCETTSITSGGSTSTTETCSPSTVTITTTGCAVTGLTTTISTATTTGTQIPCASGTCRDSCPMSGGALSGTISYTTSNYCASLSTSYTSSLPTASYGVVNSEVLATGTPTSASSKKRSHQLPGHGIPAKAIAERALPSVTPPYSSYVSTLTPSWVSQNGDVSGQWFGFPVYGHGFAGVNGIYGCTSVIIVSEKGVYVSHIWENPVFIDNDWKATDESSFKKEAFESLRDGTSTAQSITALVGTDTNPGPLHAIYAPKVFVLTPKTTDWDKQEHKITTTLRYDSRARQLGQWVASIIPGSGGSALTLGYTRTSLQASTQQGGTAGRAILEVDPFQYWLTTPNAPLGSPGLQVGRWRLWVEDQLITVQDFWTPNTTPLSRKREIGYANPCESSSATPSSSTPASSSTKIKSCAVKTRTATFDITSTGPSSSIRVSTPSMTSSTKSSTTKSSTTVTSKTPSATSSGSASSIPSTTSSTTRSASVTSKSTFTTRASSGVTTSTTRYCLNYADPHSNVDYCTCSSTTSGSVLYTSLPLMTDGYCSYTTFPAPNTSHSTATIPSTITAAPTATTTYCLNYADPHSNVDYCTCSSTSGKSVYYTSLPLMSDGYCSYTTYPASTNPYPYTKTEEGSVIAYATSTVSILNVAGYRLTETYGAGSSTVLETPAPTGFPYTTTTDDTVIAYATSTISYMDVAGYKLTLTHGAGASTIISTPSPTASCAMWSEIAAYMFLIYDIDHWNVDEDDLQNKLKDEESGCGAMTAWDFNGAMNGFAGAKFNLPTWLKSGCVERAIKSAGGPSISCEGHGTHVFDGRDSVQDIYNAL